MKIYGQKANQIAICPGESKCDIFKGAAGKGRKAKERNACTDCSMRNTKISGQKGHEALNRLAGRSMGIRNERLTGYPRKEHLMTNTEFAGLYLIEQMVEEEEIRLKSETTEIILAANNIKRGG